MSTLYIVNFTFQSESVCKPKLPLLYYICQVIELRQYSIALFQVCEREECSSNIGIGTIAAVVALATTLLTPQINIYNPLLVR